MNNRMVTQLYPAPEIEEGPGFVIRRAVPQPNVGAVGPFLLLDQIGPKVVSPGALVPLAPHPHAGMETLTYLIEGSSEHRDSAGHSQTITSGEGQWMRAGRGIIHSEGPGKPLQEHGGPLHAVQLWINLPKGHKHVDPAYRGYRRDELPTLTIGDARVRLLAGTIGDATGPVITFADPFALHASFQAAGVAEMMVPADIELGLYVMTGRVAVGDGKLLPRGSLACLSRGETVQIGANEASDVMLFGGPPLDAPVVRHGPFVMNTDEEIQMALRDYRTGRMGSLSPRVA